MQKVLGTPFYHNFLEAVLQTSNRMSQEQFDSSSVTRLRRVDSSMMLAPEAVEVIFWDCRGGGRLCFGRVEGG